MKTIYLVAVAFALCGCGAKKPDGREAALHDLTQRLAIVEGICERLKDANANHEVLLSSNTLHLNKVYRLANEGVALSTTCLTRFDLPSEVKPLIGAEVERILEERAQAFRAVARPVAVQPVGVQAKAEALKDGVPVSVWNQIAERARTKWAGDFNMQEAEIRWQTEAWRKVNR